jgi:hypothetical protein
MGKAVCIAGNGCQSEMIFQVLFIVIFADMMAKRESGNIRRDK